MTLVENLLHTLLSEAVECLERACADPQFSATNQWVWTPSETEFLIKTHIKQLVEAAKLPPIECVAVLGPCAGQYTTWYKIKVRFVLPFSDNTVRVYEDCESLGPRACEALREYFGLN